MVRPKSLPDGMTTVSTTVPAEAAKAIEALVAMTGSSEASILRQLIALGLSAYQMASDDLAASLPALPHTKKNKEK